MNVQIFATAEQVDEACAILIAAKLIEQPASVLGFATGSSPLGTYAELIRMNRAGLISFAEAMTFNLDEYVGLERDHEQSYYRFMADNLFSEIDIEEDAVHVPYGGADDLEEECRDYEDAIDDAGGVDLQLLGIGNNGHIGFNEPSDTFSTMTHVVDLTDSTIQANARFFNNSDEVPRQALSMGIGTIMDAAKIVLIATGTHKAEAVKAMIEGPVDPACPASVLQLHQDVTVLIDADAASLLFADEE